MKLIQSYVSIDTTCFCVSVISICDDDDVIMVVHVIADEDDNEAIYGCGCS